MSVLTRQQAYFSAVYARMAAMEKQAQGPDAEAIYAGAFAAYNAGREALLRLEQSADPTLTALQMLLQNALPSDVFQGAWRDNVGVLCLKAIQRYHATGEALPQEWDAFLDQVQAMEHPVTSAPVQDPAPTGLGSWIPALALGAAGYFYGRGAGGEA